MDGEVEKGGSTTMGTKTNIALRHETERLELLVADHPLTFEQFVELFGEDDDVELVNGRAVNKMAAKTPHERLQVWLLTILNAYVVERDLGVVLGSRTLVKIDGFNGRLPDLLFVRKDRMDIVKENGIYGAPDLVLEIRSPGDRPSRWVELEADYRSLGVPEIWFIDPQGKKVRVLRKEGEGYRTEIVKRGFLRSKSVSGFWLRVDWLWQSLRPKETEVLAELLGQPFP